MSSRGSSLSFVLLAVVACSGERDAPAPVDRPPPSNNPGSGSGSDGGGGDTSQGGSGAQGATGGGGSNEGGSVPVLFADCACALETLNTQNADCDQCVQQSQAMGCFPRYDDCLADRNCLPLLQELPDTCSDDRTIECAEGALAGTPTDSAQTFVAYYECLCGACSDVCTTDGAGGAGGGGGGLPQEFCEIAP